MTTVSLGRGQLWGTDSYKYSVSAAQNYPVNILMEKVNVYSLSPLEY